MKPSLPQGTRDFDAEVLKKRYYIFQTIRQQFELYGFMPLETPAFENLETLMGKYGDEGDKLIFKILNNGLDHPDKQEKSKLEFEQVLQGKSRIAITERAMKYDLTIPFARYVAMNFGKLTLPYKRYQIQPVWRADRPQRGRYREFYQCDADIIGSPSLINEVEFVSIYENVFQQLKVPVRICINNRKVLAALAELCGGEQFMMPITIAIDKLDKIGLDKVLEELKQKQIAAQHITTIQHYLNISTGGYSNEEILEKLSALFGENEMGNKGLEELRYVLGYHKGLALDVTLARGLNYYTGTILEVKPLDIQMGSIGGGGRYDDLTGLFGIKDVSGVGISFGVDRIYDVMEEKSLFPDTLRNTVTVMLVNFGAAYEARNLEILRALRSHQISCELYPEAAKFDKQLKYANKRGVAFVAMIGEEELQGHYISVKNFETGVQQKMDLEALKALKPL